MVLPERTSKTRLEMIAMSLPARRRREVIGGLLFDPFESFLDNSSAIQKSVPALMKTDIRDTSNDYELTIDLPGFKKDDITAEIKNGYLTVSAVASSDKEDKDDKGTFIRKERFSGRCSRSFYVGEDISEDDIKAKFDDGILQITIPKKEQAKEDDKKKLIQIES